MSKARPTPTPKTFKLAHRHAVIINGDLFHMTEEGEKVARMVARALYADDKGYRAALRSKEIAVQKVAIRPAK